jgi:hypothetical protein
VPLDYDRIRKCKRGQPTGKEVFGLPIVICPSWDEVASLEGQGALPVHVDEAELMGKSSLLTSEDKLFILKLKTLTNGVRLLRVAENKKNAKAQG